MPLDAVKNNTLEVLAYSNSEGSEAYRQKLSDYYAKCQIEVNADQIIITTGGSEALNFVMGSIMDFGDELIVPEPFYANYNGFATAAGVTVVPVPSKIEENFALPAIAEFEEKITPKTKAILLCNPGNPTGYLYTKEEIKKLADLVKKHDLFLVADEVYREFAYDGHQHYSVLQEPGLQQHAIMIDSVSKRYSMCGARIGCLVTRNKTVHATAMKFAQARLSPPTYAQIASEAALETPQRYFEDVKDEYTIRRDLLVNELKEIEGVKIAKPQGAFYCMVELPVDDAEDFAKWLLQDFQYEGETVMVAPAAGFYATEGLGKNQVRIAYVLDKERLKRVVTILKKALESYTPRR